MKFVLEWRKNHKSQKKSNINHGENELTKRQKNKNNKIPVKIIFKIAIEKRFKLIVH